jgi:N-acetyl-alpha-D-glucosaminyl L-malate synthase BshA
MLAPIKIPIITTLHGTDITLVGKNRSFTEVTEFSINQSDAISVVSEFLKKDTHAFFAIKKELEVIPNFVDADLFVPAGEKFPCTQFLGENHGTVFVHISNFRPVKRTLDVIHAFQKIHSEEENVTLLMVGDGPDLAACRNLVEKYGISPKVRFLGKQNDVISILQLADVLLFPSEHESFGLVALEAMSCQKPVIASRAGGLPEVVEHGVSGYLCKVGDTQEMADYGLQLVRDCTLKLSMGKKARQVVLKNFTPEKIIPLYENLYQRALSSLNN